MKKRRTKDSQTLSKELPQANTDRSDHSSNPDANSDKAEGQGASMQSAEPSQGSSQHHAPSSNNAASINNLINTPASVGSTQSPDHNANATPSTQPQPRQERTTRGKYSQGDFMLQRTLGTGSFGRVHLVQSKHNHRFYAMKVLKKAQVVKMKQIEHTNDERRMLNRVRHPFLVTLWGTWQDSRNLYMVMDFVEGGELFSLLRKSQVSGFPLPGFGEHLAYLWTFFSPSDSLTRLPNSMLRK